MLKFTKKIFIAICLLLSLTGYKSICAQGGRNFVFSLPSDKAQGLTTISFQANPTFSIMQIGEKRELFLDGFYVKKSTAQQWYGAYKWEYKYKGQYWGSGSDGGNNVPKSLFDPISIWYIKAKVVVMGGGLIKEFVTTLDNINRSLGYVSKDAKVSDYKVTIQELVDVDFEGTSAIRKYIDNLLVAKENQDKVAASNANRSSSGLTNTSSSNTTTQSSSFSKAPTTQFMSDAVGSNNSKQSNNGNNTQTKNAVSTNANNPPTVQFMGDPTTTNKVNQQTNTGLDKSKLPEFFRTTDGKFYHKQGNNITEVDYDKYMQLKKNATDQKNKTANTVNTSPQDSQKAIDDMMSKIKADQQKQIDLQNQMTQTFQLQTETMNASRQVSETKKQLMDNSSLNGTYGTVEQLMADYNSKLANVNNLMQQLSQQRQTQVNAMANQLSYSYSTDSRTAAYSDAAAAATKLIGGIVSYKKEQKEREEAFARLKREKEEALRNIEAEEKRILTNLRTDLFKKFKEGVVPTSATKINADSIFYFGYTTPANYGDKKAKLTITSIYPVYKYSDNTWPFKASIIKNVFNATSTSTSNVLHGYYTSKDEAEAMRSALIDVFTRTGGIVQEVQLKYKVKTTVTTTEDDFWETGKKTKEIKKEKPKDDFWNN